MEINEKDKELIRKAVELIKKRYKKGLTSVSSVLVTNKGNIYQGVDIELQSGPCSSCAEYSTIGNMLTNGEEKIKTIVAVADDGTILPPCGKCRELIYNVSGGETEIIVNNKEKFKLKDIEKYFWKESLK